MNASESKTTPQPASLKRMVRQVFFIMVLHPVNGWMRCGNAYASRKRAREWTPFVASAWRGLRARVASCTLRWDANGNMSERSRRVLDEKFNLNA